MASWTDSAGPEEKGVLLEQVGRNQIKAILVVGGAEPFAKIEFRHCENYRNDTSHNHFELIETLEPYEAKLLGEALITAAQAAQNELKKIKNLQSKKVQ